MAKTETVLKVKGMSCSHCVAAVKKAVGSLSGVYDVEVDLAAGKVTVSHDSEEATVGNIRDAIEDQGYDVAD